MDTLVVEKKEDKLWEEGGRVAKISQGEQRRQIKREAKGTNLGGRNRRERFRREEMKEKLGGSREDKLVEGSLALFSSLLSSNYAFLGT